MMRAEKATTRLVDTHCHLDAPDFVTDVREVIARGRDAGVGWFVAIGSGRSTESAPDAIALARTNRDVVACVGIHPLDATCATDNVMGTLAELAEDWHVVGIGETGLDYRHAYAQKEAQKAAFRGQIQLARKAKKPLIIHSRSATADTLAILREESAQDVGGILHSFTGSADYAFAAMDLGFDISFSALILLHDLPELRAIAKKIPMDRLMIESNAPVNAPPPHRDRRCEPAHLPLVAEGLAQILGVDTEELARRTTENALKRFGLAEEQSA